MATKKEMMIAVKAVQSNFCNQKQVQKSLDLQRQIKKERDEDISLLTIMKKKGYLTSEQIQTLKDSLPKIKTIKLEDNPIDGYELIEKIGQGGMAIVFLAKHAKHGKVALKILFPHHNSNQEYVEGFVNEAKLVCKMEHTNLVKGLDFGKCNEHYFLAMEYVRGSRSVKDVLDEKGPFEEDEALHIIVQVAKALVYISEYGILHRDIKPDNTLITNNGTVKVCDLGFAKTIEKNAKKSGLTCGTVQYISPEQAKGQGDVDVRSDIYSLGATLYHLVMGKVPFTGADSMEVMAKQVLEGLNDIKNRKVSHHMHYFIEKMMAKDRSVRYQDPQELIEDVENTMKGKKSLAFDEGEIKMDLGFDSAEEDSSSRRENTRSFSNKKPKSQPIRPPDREKRSSENRTGSGLNIKRDSSTRERRSSSEQQIKSSRLERLKRGRSDSRKSSSESSSEPTVKTPSRIPSKRAGGVLDRGKNTKKAGTQIDLEGLQNLFPSSKKESTGKPAANPLSSTRRRKR